MREKDNLNAHCVQQNYLHEMQWSSTTKFIREKSLFPATSALLVSHPRGLYKITKIRTRTWNHLHVQYVDKHSEKAVICQLIWKYTKENKERSSLVQHVTKVFAVGRTWKPIWEPTQEKNPSNATYVDRNLAEADIFPYIQKFIQKDKLESLVNTVYA